MYKIKNGASHGQIVFVAWSHFPTHSSIWFTQKWDKDNWSQIISRSSLSQKRPQAIPKQLLRIHYDSDFRWIELCFS